MGIRLAISWVVSQEFLIRTLSSCHNPTHSLSSTSRHSSIQLASTFLHDALPTSSGGYPSDAGSSLPHLPFLTKSLNALLFSYNRILVYSPQIYENYNIQSGEGLSLLFLLAWIVGDLCNLVGAIIGGLVSTVIVLAIYVRIQTHLPLFPLSLHSMRIWLKDKRSF